MAQPWTRRADVALNGIGQSARALRRWQSQRGAGSGGRGRLDEERGIMAATFRGLVGLIAEPIR